MRLLFLLLVLFLLAWSNCALSHPTWSTNANAHFPRFESTTALHNDKLNVVNGFDSNDQLENTVAICNPRSNTWTLRETKTDIGTGNTVTHNGTILIDDNLWIFGGRIGANPGAVSNKVWIYNIPTDNWTQGPALPVPFAGGGAARVGNNLHVFGGVGSARELRC